MFVVFYFFSTEPENEQFEARSVCGQGFNSAITVKQCDCVLIILYKDRQQGLEDVSGDISLPCIHRDLSLILEPRQKW